tara:strand:+ start:1613 stop:2818 length:1206 start_codon:yes stop_codon:yes gene_type:complete
MMSENENDLFNEVMLALAVPSRMLVNRGFQRPQTHKGADWSIRNTRQLLSGSTKFIVSDSLLRHAVLASLVKPKALLEACKWGIPPIENMWIEWNEHRRVELMAEQLTAMGVKIADENDDTYRSERVGYHISPVKGLNMYSLFFRDNDNKIAVPLNAFYIKNEDVISAEEFVRDRETNMFGQNTDWNKGSMDAKLSFFADHQRLYGKVLLGTPYCSKIFSGPEHQKYIDQVCQRMTFGMHPFAGAAYQASFVNPVDSEIFKTPSDFKNWFEASIQMNYGDARFLMTLMALINYPNILIERDQPEVQQRMIAGRRVPRNEMRVIELDLPKPRGVTRYQRMFRGMGTPKRQHVRRGHVRTIRHKDGTETTRWIPEMVVGDPSLGRIDHQYDLKTKGSKNADKV